MEDNIQGNNPERAIIPYVGPLYPNSAFLSCMSGGTNSPVNSQQMMPQSMSSYVTGLLFSMSGIPMNYALNAQPEVTSKEEQNYKTRIDKAYTQGAALGFFRTFNLPEAAAKGFSEFLSCKDAGRLAQTNRQSSGDAQAEKEKLLPASLLENLGPRDALLMMETLDAFGVRNNLVITPDAISIPSSAIKDLAAFQTKLSTLSRNNRTFEISTEKDHIIINTAIRHTALRYSRLGAK
jgi:hypothetical protein